MKNEKISLEIATLKKSLKEKMPSVVRTKIEAKIEKLEKELKSQSDSSVDFTRKILVGKKKVKDMSQKQFNDLIKELSKKPEYDFLKYLTKKQIEDDLDREAKPVGYRFVGRKNFKIPTKADIKAKRGVYYENRSNRTDVNRSVRLAKGGMIQHGLKVGDEIVEFSDNIVVVKNNSKTFVVNLNQGTRISEGQFFDKSNKEIKKFNTMAKGGSIGEELMGGQPSQKKPSGAILLEVRKRGREIVVTEDGGKTKEVYVKSNGYSGYTLHYNGNQYEFAHSLDSKEKGGEVSKSTKEAYANINYQLQAMSDSWKRDNPKKYKQMVLEHNRLYKMVNPKMQNGGDIGGME